MEIEKLISIHAPRVRGDLTPSNFSQETKDFNPRPSCEGRPSSGLPSLRTANFNPRPSCEGRLYSFALVVMRLISIHAPRVRGDTMDYASFLFCSDFNPRPSCEGRRRAVLRSMATRISIHAPRVRGDREVKQRFQNRDISIHAPRVRGDSAFPSTVILGLFQSTPLV